MKRFVATLRYNEIDTYINIEADRMTIDDTIMYAWLEGEMVAAVDMGVVIEAHLATRGENPDVQLKFTEEDCRSAVTREKYNAARESGT